VIDIQEQKKVRKRSLIFAAIAVLLFAALWLAAVIETRNVEVTVRSTADAEETSVQQVTNPFLKRIFLNADRQLSAEKRSETERQYFNAEDLWQFSVRDGKDASVRYYWIEGPNTETGKWTHGSGLALYVMENGKTYACTGYTVNLISKLEMLCQWHQ